MDVRVDPSFYYAQETHHNFKSRYLLRVKGWKKIFQENGPERQAIVAIVKSDKIDSKPKQIRQATEGYYIFIKRKNPPRGNCSS